MFNDWDGLIDKFSFFQHVMLYIFHKVLMKLAQRQPRNNPTWEGIYGMSNLLWNAGVSRPDSSRLHALLRRGHSGGCTDELCQKEVRAGFPLGQM
jgi:hypothetical protein